MKENKQDKFERLATQRVNAAINQIRLIGNLSNKNLYKFSDNDRKKIIKALNDAVKDCDSRFKGTEKKDFKLK
tara:strand:- start:469 stop:687 length:219 start_codon:yes stop_codon:yes gene_type:complete